MSSRARAPALAGARTVTAGKLRRVRIEPPASEYAHDLTGPVPSASRMSSAFCCAAITPAAGARQIADIGALAFSFGPGGAPRKLAASRARPPGPDSRYDNLASGCLCRLLVSYAAGDRWDQRFPLLVAEAIENAEELSGSKPSSLLDGDSRVAAPSGRRAVSSWARLGRLANLGHGLTRLRTRFRRCANARAAMRSAGSAAVRRSGASGMAPATLREQENSVDALLVRRRRRLHEKNAAANHDLAAATNFRHLRCGQAGASHHRTSSPANRFFEGGGFASRSLDSPAYGQWRSASSLGNYSMGQASGRSSKPRFLFSANLGRFVASGADCVTAETSPMPEPRAPFLRLSGPPRLSERSRGRMPVSRRLGSCFMTAQRCVPFFTDFPPAPSTCR
jgi:hypothetical protein